MTNATKSWSRSEVPIEQTWDLTDLFATDEEWENELSDVQEDVKNVTQYKGKLNSSAETLLAGLREYEEHTRH